MKIQKKLLLVVFLSILFLLVANTSFATKIVDINKVDFTDEYKEYLNLPEEQRNKIIPPRMYTILKKETKPTNPFKITRSLGISYEPNFSLQSIIPANLVIKNQMKTNSCWTFAALSSLETNLAMRDYNRKIQTPVVYDFSERHMEYATTKTFADKENIYGLNRKVGSGANFNIALNYLTNGQGAIPESEMAFQNNEDPINISEIQNKTVSSQVYDAVDFPSYKVGTDDLTNIKQQMKEHIKTYGSISACIYGAQPNTQFYNEETSAIYCDTYDLTQYPINHAVSIIGWDDGYQKTNFKDEHQPKENGAWIIRNSWGDSIGKGGFMYISYEDVYIYSLLGGITNSSDTIDYDHIYQYNEFGSTAGLELLTNKLYLANVFTKESENLEALTQVSVSVLEDSKYKVYVNPNGDDKTLSNLVEVQLKSGNEETLSAGYHTLEFLKPIKITGNTFTVVLQIKPTDGNNIVIPVENYDTKILEQYPNFEIYNVVKTEKNKCFFTTENYISTNNWGDLGNITESRSDMANSDSTIKAFTQDMKVSSIKVGTMPTKTKYIQNEESLNLQDGTIIITYSNGLEEEIPMNSEGVDVSEFSNENTGTVKITLTYETKTTDFNVEVISTPEETTSPSPETSPTPEETTSPSPETSPTPEETTSPSPETSPTPEETTSPSPETSPTPEETTSPSPETSPTPEETTPPSPETSPSQEPSTGPKAEPANLTNAKCTIKTINAFYYTNNIKEEYVIIKADIDTITRSLKNDNVEYYYYLSSKQEETNIKDWVKITDSQNSKNKLSITIDTRESKNYEELSSYDVIYLYIKEVVTKGEDQKTTISKSMQLQSDVPIAKYLDDALQVEGSYEVEEEKLPQTGIVTDIVIIVIGIITIIGVCAYLKYKTIDK